jgi:hypothetical protein
MDPLDYPIRHFEQMSRLAARLKIIPAQVLEHEYSCDSFGSWVLTIRCKGRPLRLIYDGRDREYVLEQSEVYRRPYSWDLLWRRPSTSDDDSFFEEIVDVVGRAAGIK